MQNANALVDFMKSSFGTVFSTWPISHGFWNGIFCCCGCNRNMKKMSRILLVLLTNRRTRLTIQKEGLCNYFMRSPFLCFPFNNNGNQVKRAEIWPPYTLHTMAINDTRSAVIGPFKSLLMLRNLSIPEQFATFKRISQHQRSSMSNTHNFLPGMERNAKMIIAAQQFIIVQQFSTMCNASWRSVLSIAQDSFSYAHSGKFMSLFAKLDYALSEVLQP